MKQAGIAMDKTKSISSADFLPKNVEPTTPVKMSVT